MPTKKPVAHKKPSKSRRLVSRQTYSNKVLLVFALIFAAVGGYILWFSFAAPTAPAVYLSGAPTYVSPGQTFTVQVRENSGSTGVNAVEADISYPATLLTYKSISYSGSAFGYPIQTSGGSGAITIAAGQDCTSGTCPPLNTGDVLVATITFQANTTSGAAALNMTTGTNIAQPSGTKLITTLSSTWNATVTVDATAPTVSITAPTNGSSVGSATGSVSVTTNAADTGSGIQKVEFYVDGVLNTTDSTSPYSFTWNFGSALGVHSLTAKAYDNTGNSATSTAVSVTINDTTAPAAPANFRVTGTTINGVSLAWNASTDNVGVTGYKITRNGTLITTTPLSSATLTYNDSGLSAATTYNYTVVAIDAAGNSSSASSISGTTSTVTPGDLNADGHVDLSDLSIMASKWKTTDATADLNHDGIVDISDLAILLSHYTG